MLTAAEDIVVNYFKIVKSSRLQPNVALVSMMHYSSLTKHLMTVDL